MRRTPVAGVLAFAALVLFTASASAEVVILGLFGRRILVPSPVEVRVAPAMKTLNDAPIVSTPVPVVRPDMDADVLPPPRLLKTEGGAVPPAPQPAAAQGIAPQAIAPRDFVKAFKPAPGAYEVTFLHSRTKQPVTVAFELPPGNPEVSFVGHSLLFDYGRHEVEIRFQVGGKVKVSRR